MAISDSVIASDKKHRAMKVRALSNRLPNKYNGDPCPPELPPGIEQEPPPSVPQRCGRWPCGKEWTVAECRALYLRFRRCESEDELTPNCLQCISSRTTSASLRSALLPTWDDKDVQFDFNVATLGIENPNFARKLAFTSSFAPDVEHTKELWAHFLNALGLHAPQWQTRNTHMLVEFTLTFAYVTSPHFIYCCHQHGRTTSAIATIKIPVHAFGGYKRPMGFRKHAKQKGYCEMASHLLAIAHEMYTTGQYSSTNHQDIIVYGFSIYHTTIKGWKAVFPMNYLRALQQDDEPSCGPIDLCYSPSLDLGKVVERHRAASMVLGIFHDAAAVN